MMKNTTMKMSVNPQESMDKFLQRLEKSVMDFLETGNKTKVGFDNKLFPLLPLQYRLYLGSLYTPGDFGCRWTRTLKTKKGIGNNSKTSARCSFCFE